jgi:hypothetical protein
MKKYLWIVALVAALTMVFVGCGDGDDSGETPPVDDKVTINFSWNTPASYTANGGPAITAPNPVTINKGAAIGALPAGPSGVGEFGIIFKGWYLAETGGSPISAATTFSASATVYAQWTEYNPETEVMITFNYNYSGAPESAVIKFTRGVAAGSNWPSDPSRPGNTPGKDTMNDTWAFKGWKQYEVGGSGDTYTSASTMPGTVLDDTVWAYWEPSTGWLSEVAPEGTDLAGAEMVVLENAWYPAYYFELPAGKAWSDFNGITFDFMVGPENINKGSSCRGIRLMGNYVNADFALKAPDSAGIGNFPDGIMIADYNNNKNAPFILNDLNQAWKTIGEALSDLGMEAETWKWKTISHKIDGSSKNSGYDDANLPADGATGPFIFGVAITGQAGGGTTSYLRKITLVGNTGTESVLAKPLYFSEGGKTFPAFCGYSDGSGGNGYKEAYRGMADGSTPVAVPK